MVLKVFLLVRTKFNPILVMNIVSSAVVLMLKILNVRDCLVYSRFFKDWIKEHLQTEDTSQKIIFERILLKDFFYTKVQDCADSKCELHDPGMTGLCMQLFGKSPK